MGYLEHTLLRRSGKRERGIEGDLKEEWRCRDLCVKAGKEGLLRVSSGEAWSEQLCVISL